jgi:hypothetical protein
MGLSADTIRQFITTRGKTQIFLVTTTSAGAPSVRRVGAFVQPDWSAGVMSSVNAVKLKHLRRTPKASIVWADNTAQENARTRNVVISGDVEVVDGNDQVNAFLKRRSEIYPEIAYRPVSDERKMSLILVRPTLLRAEGFIDGEPETIYAIRDFATSAVEKVHMSW